MVDFHGVVFPEPSSGTLVIWGAGALRNYDALSEELKAKYKDDAMKIANKVSEQYSQLSDEEKNKPTLSSEYKRAETIINSLNKN